MILKAGKDPADYASFCSTSLLNDDANNLKYMLSFCTFLNPAVSFLRIS